MNSSREEFAEKVDRYRKHLGDWDLIMANAMAHFTEGQIKEAQFLLKFAREVRQMAAQRAVEFEDLRSSLENAS